MNVNKIQKKYNFLTPILKEGLIRLGNKMDGGYVVDDLTISEIDTFLSFGLGDGSNTDNTPWSFENDLLKKNPYIEIIIYDHSVSIKDYLRIIIKYLRRFLTFRTNFFELNRRINYLKNYLYFIRLKNVNFFKKKVVGKLNDNGNCINIKKIFRLLEDKKRSIGLKCDIEGSEYYVIEDILHFSQNIQLMIIEFHWTDKKNDLFINLIKKIQKNFEIIHLHGNNFKSVNEEGLPNVIEITFLKKEKINTLKKKYKYNFPIKNLDFPCDPLKKDIEISFDIPNFKS